jgi:hypothetical protein
LRLRETVRDWNAGDEKTTAYADLMFAFALTRPFAAALGLAPAAIAQDQLAALGRVAVDIKDTFTTAAYFCLARLWIIEAALQPLLVPARSAVDPEGYPADLAWLARQGRAVWELEQAIHEEGHFADLPVLADVMEKAGCSAGAVLAQLRESGRHDPGCRTFAVLLGKE